MKLPDVYFGVFPCVADFNRSGEEKTHGMMNRREKSLQ